MAAPHKPAADPSDEELRRIYESDSLAKELGVHIDFADDEDAPPVDRDQVRAFIRKELPVEAADEIYHLITGFRPWHAAWMEILVDEHGGN